MKDTIDANLKDKAIEKMRAPKNPDIALLTLSCYKVIGNGLFTGVIDIDEDAT